MSDRPSPVAGFPPYPHVEPLPEMLSDDQKRSFALALIAEHGTGLGDYLFAAVRQYHEYETQMRWIEMTELVNSLHDGPIHLSYRACDRIATERAERERKALAANDG